MDKNRKINVLMIGPARSVKGGMTTVVDNYLEFGLDIKINLRYIETINDKNLACKIIKELNGKIQFLKYINKYDLVHIHMASRRSTFRKCWYIKKAKAYNKKIILHIHGGAFKDFFENECTKGQKKYIAKCLNLCDRIIVLSDEWKNYFSSIVDSSKIVVIYNGVKVPTKTNKIFNYKIAFLGRMTKEKGIIDLLNSIASLKEKYPNIHLTIAGEGIDLKDIIKELKIEDNVSLLGWINSKDRNKLLNDCFFFCLPSYYEAMPMSLLEAMSFGCVTIASKVGSIPEIIVDNKNGILVEAGNIKEISEKIDFLFRNEEKSKEISKNAIYKVKKDFNIENSVEKIIDLYKEIM